LAKDTRRRSTTTKATSPRCPSTPAGCGACRCTRADLVNDCRTVIDAELDPATVAGSAPPARPSTANSMQFLRVHGVAGGPGRFLRTGLAELADPDPPAPSPLRTAARAYQNALDDLTRQAGIAA
jgi:hypothetical protein